MLLIFHFAIYIESFKLSFCFFDLQFAVGSLDQDYLGKINFSLLMSTFLLEVALHISNQP